MRAMNVVSIFAAGSGHPGGTLSVMDIAAALYLNVLNHDPSNPTWPERDRVFWSAGHKAPALYVALGRAGYFPLDDVVFLRQLGSGFEGHPNCLKLPGVEVSSGSLGQGLGAAVGNALAARLRGVTREFMEEAPSVDAERDDPTIAGIRPLQPERCGLWLRPRETPALAPSV